ncbi:MAG TPA: hypothetical protein DDX68_22320 [Clostridium sp.]|nr:hypothetical protein [Clostridium sp.]
MGHIIKAPVKLADFILAVFIVIAFHVTGRRLPAAELLDLLNQIVQVTEDMAENQVNTGCINKDDKKSKEKNLKAYKLNPVKKRIVIPEINVIPVHIGNMAGNNKFFFIVQCGNEIGVFLLLVAGNDFRAVCVVKSSCRVDSLFP